MADTPALTDIQDSSFDTQAWVLSDKVNRNAAGGLTGAKPEAQAGSKPTAEFANGVSAALRQINQIFRGEETLDQPMVLSQVVYNVDFSTLASNTFADGTESIDGKNWTVAGTATTNTFEIDGSTGLRFNATTTSTTYTTTTVDCARLNIAPGTLVSSWHPAGVYLIETYWSSLTLGVNNNRIAISLYRNITGTDTLLATGRHRVSGNQVAYVQSGTTISNSESTTTHNVFSMLVDRSGCLALSGTYGADFPTYPTGYTDNGWAPAPQGGTASLMSPTGSLFMIAFPTGEAGGNMDATLRRLRITRVG